MDEQRLWAFVAAWERRDIAALMEDICDDCVYITTTGPGPGTEYVGKDAIQRGFLIALEDDAADSESSYGPLFMAGNRAALEWASTYTDATGKRVTVRGCDLLEFMDGKIHRKDAFRKVLG